MSFTTSGGLRSTWKLSATSPDVFAKMFRCPLPEAERRFGRARSEYADPRVVREMIDRLSVPAIAALAALVRAGGTAEPDQLAIDVAEHFRIPRRDFERSIAELISAVFVIPLMSGGSRELLAILDVAAPGVVAAVSGLELPALDPQLPVVPDPAHDDGRGLIVAAMATRHSDFKLNQNGELNRTTLKRGAKQLGVDETRLATWIDVAVALELVRPDRDDVLRPDVAAIAALARGDVFDPRLAVFMRLLRERGAPITIEAVRHWMRQTALRSPGAPIRADQVVVLPSVRLGRQGDRAVVEWVARPTATAATVTPSFEVYLPPEGSLEQVVDVLACAELERIDRVVVARITKAAVRRAIAAGARGPELVAGLARASRVPIPQNVEASILDWATSLTVAKVGYGWAVVVPADAHDRAAKALEGHAAQALAQGVWLVDADVTSAMVTKLLDKAGIAEVRISDADGPLARSAEREPGRTSPSRSNDDVPFVEGDRALQQRIAAFQAGDVAETARTKIGPEARRSSELDEHGDEDGDALDISEEAIERVERWEREHEALSDDLATACAAIIDVLPVADRDYLLGARTREALADRLDIVMNHRHGLERFVQKHSALVGNVLGAAAAQSIARPDGPVSGVLRDAPAGERPWIRDDLLGRLYEAARANAVLELDIAGRVQTARLLRVVKQGKAAMLLAEDVSDDSSIATPVVAIRAIREPSSAGEPDESETMTRAAWFPLPGQPQPPGHIPCPCGSGQRYRACCRDAARS